MTMIDSATLEMESPVAESPPEQPALDYSTRNNSGPNNSKRKPSLSSALSKAVGSPPVSTIMIPVDQIGPSPYNPRNVFDDTGLQALKDSIELEGLIQPIIVRDNADVPRSEDFGDHPTRYTIIAGERRWRAVQLIPQETIRAEVRKVGSDLEAAEITVSENFMREGFNPIEEAIAFRTLHALGKKQAEIADMVGRKQAAISKALSLLELPPPVQDLIARRVMTASHGQLLHRVYKSGPDDLGGNETVILNTANMVVKENWTIRDLDDHLNMLFPPVEEPSLGLEVSPGADQAFGDQVFAGPHPPTPPTAGEFVHWLHTGEITESVQMAMDAQNARAAIESNSVETEPKIIDPEVIDADPIDKPNVSGEDIVEAEVVDTDPADFDFASSSSNAPTPAMHSGSATGQAIGAAPAPPAPLSKAGDPTPAAPTPAPKAEAKNMAAGAAAKTEPAKTEPAKPAPTASAPSLPPGWTNAMVKEADYIKARDMGLWPPAYAIDAFQELTDKITSLEIEMKQLRSSAESRVLEDGFIHLGTIPLIAGKKLVEWNRLAGGEVLTTEDTPILHALYPDREFTTLEMIAQTLLVARFRRCRAMGLGDDEEMPEGLAEALAAMIAQSS